MCPLGSAWTHQGHVRLWCEVRLGMGHRLSSCGGCGCDRCSQVGMDVLCPVPAWPLCPLWRHVPRQGVRVSAWRWEWMDPKGCPRSVWTGCVMFRGCGVGRGSGFSEVVRPGRVQEVFFDVLGVVWACV